MTKMKYSEIDNQGRLYVDCIECAAGTRIKKPNTGGCFSGALKEGLTQ